MIEYPDRIPLAQTPTPIQRLLRTEKRSGPELWVKRDDLTGIELSGNKIRKLEFLFAEAKSEGADTVITCGGEQSNHCRATALAATRLGLKSVVVLRTADPQSPPPTTGNILLDRLAGAEIVWISRADWARRAEILAREADRVRGDGGVPYVIPEGGSNAVGLWGYVGCAEELDFQLKALRPCARTTILYACGSGGTGAGLIVGAAMLGWRERGIAVCGINVCDDRDYFVTRIGEICNEAHQRFAIPAITEDDIDIIDGFVGRGYAISRPEELSTLRDLARTESLILDPVYTGKAYFGMTETLSRDPERFGDRVVFLCSGGIFGLFPQAAELAALL